ncbi:MAG: AAA family ATPase [Lachnospiraceae bacterium]|jgi:hypothetical protein|nr:AAA family ATPase [Lachnospiraceae bacterium]
MVPGESKKMIDDGNPDFRSIVTGNGLYIDKTRYIEVLEGIGKFHLVLRPKRFGKSLFTSMLKYYYDVAYKDEFDALFGGLYIHENKTALANSYNVLKFDFSGINSDSDKLEYDFTDKVKMYLNDTIDRKKLGFQLEESSAPAANLMLRDFLRKYRNVTDAKLYLLVDEYDNFANAVLGKDFDYFRDITSKSGFVRSFYEVFKEFSGDVVERVYITGVTPITLDALASGFNYVTNRSLDARISDMIGFTEQEVSDMVDYYGLDPVHKEALREYYDGYLFSDESEDGSRIYNSTLVFYYLAKLIGVGKAPKNLIDARVQSDPGMVRNLIDLYQDTETKLSIMETIQRQEELPAMIALKFEQGRFMESQDDLISMMYYLGFLTIRENQTHQSMLGIPNRTIEALYSNLYLSYVNRRLIPSLSDLNVAVNAMLQRGDYGVFLKYLAKNLSLLSDHDFDHMNEQGIKNFIIAYLRLYQDIHLETELDVGGGNHIDAAILPAPLTKFDHYYVVEMKYLSKAKDTPAARAAKRAEAMGQLSRYRASAKVAEVEKHFPIHKLIILVVKNEVTAEEV